MSYCGYSGEHLEIPYFILKQIRSTDDSLLDENIHFRLDEDLMALMVHR